jgi:hypothetical protein
MLLIKMALKLSMVFVLLIKTIGNFNLNFKNGFDHDS